MRLRQHTPGFIDGDKPKQLDIDSLDELLAIDWVKSWSADPSFIQYSQSNNGVEHLLMAEFQRETREYWVIGYMTEDMGLPEFKAR